MARRGMLGAGVGVLALAVGALVWLDASEGTLRADVVPMTISWFLVACVGYGLVMGSTQRAGASCTATGLGLLLLVGFGLRLLLLVTEPTLSDDVYRYLWEGHLVTEGVSPYSFAIDAPAADAYDIAARSLANNTSLASPYLPVAHGVFGLSALVLPLQPWSMQLVMIGFDVVAAAMIVMLLDLASLPRVRVLLYWLNPLVMVEVAHGAHLDAMILALIAAGLWCSLTAQTSPFVYWGAPGLIAAATLTRPIAFLVVPVLFWVWDRRQRGAWVAGVAVPVLAIGAFVGFGFGDEGTGVFGSARAYTETFRFNSGAYHWLERWIASRGLDDKGWNEPLALTRLVVALVVAVVLLAVFVVARRHDDSRSVLRLAAVPVAMYVLLTPVLHPWYVVVLLGLVPFLAPGAGEPSQRWVVVAPWLTLSVLLIFSYLTYQDPSAFAEREWVRRLEWIPTLSLVAMTPFALGYGQRST